MEIKEHQEIKQTLIDRAKEVLKSRRSNIDSILSDRVADFHLIDEQPIPIMIAGKRIFVGTLTMDNYNIFLKKAAEMFSVIGINLINFETLGDGMKLTEVLLTHKALQKKMKQLVKNTILKQQEYYYKEIGYEKLHKIKLQKCSWRHFKKNISLEKLVQILFLVYIYNFDAQKKNLFIIAERMTVNNLAANYIYSWLQSLDGLTGKFGVALLEKQDLLHVDLQNKETLNQNQNN